MKSDLIGLVCIALTFTIFLTRFHVTEAEGFTVDLIHRDSLQSPSLNSVLTPSEKVSNALRRSFNRLHAYTHHNTTRKSASTVIVPDKGEYLLKFSLGTPPVETLAIADTGSDLIWIQCKPCAKCFKQTAPIFEPKGSSSYKMVPCSSNACTDVQRSSCNGTAGACNYRVMYGDNSFSLGEVATETITLGGKTIIPNVVMGCGHLDQGTFGAGASGIVGLGGGKVSLIKQMGASIQGKFAYCLVPSLGENAKPSKMSFGDQAVVSGSGVVTTPIVARSPDTFYYLTLEGVTVGAKRLDVYDPMSRLEMSTSSKAFGEGNIIIDSGTTLTFLPSTIYSQVTTAVKSQVKARSIVDPAGILNLCYEDSVGNDDLPQMIFHFKGADVKLNALNAFVKTTESSLCLAFAPASSISIFGNLAQMNLLVGYDLVKKTVSFKPTDCSTYV